METLVIWQRAQAYQTQAGLSLIGSVVNRSQISHITHTFTTLWVHSAHSTTFHQWVILEWLTLKTQRLRAASWLVSCLVCERVSSRYKDTWMMVADMFRKWASHSGMLVNDQWEMSEFTFRWAMNGRLHYKGKNISSILDRSRKRDSHHSSDKENSSLVLNLEC